MTDELDTIRLIFFEECDELLVELDRHLQAFEAGSSDPESINGAFRAIHSIKGGAGAFALGSLIAFAHAYETALDAVRSGRLALSPKVVGVLRRAADRLADHVEAAKQGRALDNGDALEIELGQLAGSRDEVDLDQLFGEAAAPVAPSVPNQAPPAGLRRLELRLHPRQDLFRRAVEPAMLIRMLRELGRVKVKRVEDAAVPPLAELDPSDCWLAWELELETDAALGALHTSLEPFLDPDEYTIVDPAAEATETVSAAPLPSTPVPAAAAVAAPTPRATPPAAARSAEAAAAGSETRAGGSIRVDIGRIDRLINLVGEIVVVQAVLAEQSLALDASRHSGLIDAVVALSRRSRELHEAVMAVRAQPVKTVFQRLPRLVRELSQALGKQAKLVLFGESTEVDKTIIEELSEPLTHLLRNAMDHGLEPAEERLAAGKPPEGTITIGAEQRGGRIVITVADDGRGINREKLLAKASSRGLVPEGTRLAPEEIDALIFHPGLSTADSISDVSGRGVGMDVVKRNIQAMGGRIGLHSEPGQGCRFTLSLPLTLAVLDGMVLKLGTQRYVVPLQSIVETICAGGAAVNVLPGGREALRMRDHLIPLVRLAAAMGLPADTAPAAGGEDDVVIVVIETETGQRIALLVDEIIGQQQVVVRSIEQAYGQVRGVAGASILGDGRVALILDADALPQLAARPALTHTSNWGETAVAVHKPANSETPTAALPGGGTFKIVTFLVADRQFGVPMRAVREIKRWMETTPLPHVPAYVRGVLNLRGTILAVYDLRARLGLGLTEPTKDHIIIIVSIDDRLIGLLVDAVCDIPEVTRADVQPVPDLAATDDTPLLGVILREEAVVSLLNLHQVAGSAAPAAIDTRPTA
ncbi:chemotaxis protein CheW [Benzoatithermus flavus]|uniref:Chemotaxis protein CheA n=1 Tax=Benzoatithermus flavus TaxID=3108223 RepID=A0ABU8XUX0_9PROT